MTFHAASDGLTSELVLLDTELKGDVSESRGLCFVDGECHSTVALCYVAYCISQSLVDKIGAGIWI